MLTITNQNIAEVSSRVWYNAVFKHFRNGCQVSVLDGSGNILLSHFVNLTIDRNTPCIDVSFDTHAIADGKASSFIVLSADHQVKLMAVVSDDNDRGLISFHLVDRELFVGKKVTIEFKLKC